MNNNDNNNKINNNNNNNNGQIIQQKRGKGKKETREKWYVEYKNLKIITKIKINN